MSQIEKQGRVVAGCTTSVWLRGLGYAEEMILAECPIRVGATLFTVGIWDTSILARCLTLKNPKTFIRAQHS